MSEKEVQEGGIMTARTTIDRPFKDYLMRGIGMKNPTTEVLAEIVNERYKQDGQWGEQNHLPSYWMTILMEEVGEACKNALEAYPIGDPLRSKKEALNMWRAEMIQVAAVAVAAVECYDRNKEHV